jgi:hypothetical protein
VNNFNDNETTTSNYNRGETGFNGYGMMGGNGTYRSNSYVQGGVYPGSFINPIPNSVNGNFYAASTSFTANYHGGFYYICQYPGHASKGMYGKIIVQ